ncbi:MAG TPA: rhomboid family intramembrane serine protease [Hymenobacter sp.]|uniref:rhomboid family intramembrane serine protease n=1 Tax=Hymenobacter sp. TaxID=1898978 RepID=UPI002D7FF0FA|nr:rhomboid family intramembrane serine protease [Hymenobacter sp.]HET9506169.1 rhomboid family intramembrane serine protease [Hymenobacter sp.]
MSVIQDIRDAFSRRDNVLNQLIIINVLVFTVLIIVHAGFFLSKANEAFDTRVIPQFALSSDLRVLLRHPWTLLTYAFTHENLFHIVFNMLNLYWFGQLLREYLGSQRLLSVYILGALAGAAAFLLFYNVLPVFASSVGAPMLGASASVVAIIVAAATLLPDYTFVMFLFGTVKIKWIALVVVVVLSVANIFQGNPGGGIAHLGGALLGYVFIKQQQAGRDLGRPVHAVGSWVGRLFERRPAGGMKVTHRTGGASRPAAKSAEATDVDAILDKISRSGYESLSKDEKQQLFRASQQ